MLPSVVRLLRIASLLICLVVAASFLVFAIDQTKTASGHQQEQVAAIGPGAASTPAKHGTHESSIHEGLDEASRTLTSPFAGIVSDSNSEWATRGGRLILALLVYGFGLGFIARTLRVRM